jgi:hypothetical protein
MHVGTGPTECTVLCALAPLVGRFFVFLIHVRVRGLGVGIFTTSHLPLVFLAPPGICWGFFFQGVTVTMDYGAPCLKDLGLIFNCRGDCITF